MTMTLISTVTVGVATNSLSFDNIPQTAKDLYVKVSVRNTFSGALGMRFNNVSTSVYSMRYLFGTGSTAGSGQISPDSYIYIGNATAAAMTANTFSSAAITVPAYSDIVTKCSSNEMVAENNAAAASSYLVAGQSTATTAITSLQLFALANNFAIGTTASLYTISTAGASGATVA